MLLFHQSVRHSGDLDLLLRTDERPKLDALKAALGGGLASVAEALNLAPIQFEDLSKSDLDTKLWVKSADGRPLFRIDLNRYGSVLESEVEEHVVALDDDKVARVKSASRDFLLLQKAECFLLRKIVKARDAFDIRLLADSGASLNETLKNHFSDTLMSYEIEREDIMKRIEQSMRSGAGASWGLSFLRMCLARLRSKGSNLCALRYALCTQIGCSTGEKRWTGSRLFGKKR